MIQRVSEIKPFPVRMPANLRSWYELEAENDKRALNFVVVEALIENKERKVKERKETL